ncbi:MAG: polysaccharide transporter ATP-binding protein, partial [Paenibacillus sp.]|nr:polysaccharide transporter ATP-binding protein [Paenibacillus sp.]
MDANVESHHAIKKRKRGKRVYKKTLFALYLLFTPTFLTLFVFQYIPMYGVLIAFQDFSPFLGVTESPWIGFKHFIYFAQDDTFWKVLKNTLILNFYDLVFGFTAPIVFALLVNEIWSKWFKRLAQTISYLPHFLSWIVVSGVFYQMLSPTTGMVNALLDGFGIEPIFFMAEEKLFRG